MKRKPLKKTSTLVRKGISRKPSRKLVDLREKDKVTYKIVYERAKGRCEQTGDVVYPTEFEAPDGKVLAPWRFSHVLTKEAYPEARHDPENIMYLSSKELHTSWEHGGEEDRKKLDKIWQRYLQMKKKYGKFSK